MLQYEPRNASSFIKTLPKASTHNRHWEKLNERFGGAICLPQSCMHDDIFEVMEVFFFNTTLKVSRDQEILCKKFEEIEMTNFQIVTM